MKIANIFAVTKLVALAALGTLKGQVIGFAVPSRSLARSTDEQVGSLRAKNRNELPKATSRQLQTCTWSQLGNDINGEGAEDRAGKSVSLSADGMTMAIGARGNNDGTGHVRVFRRTTGDDWIQLGDDIDGKVQESFGSSISLSSDGRTVAIGAPFSNANGFTSGLTRVFNYNDNTGWTQVGSNINGQAEGDRSGYSVSLSANGNIMAVAAPFHTKNGVYGSGRVRVLSYNVGIGWTQLGDSIDGEYYRAYFGFSVSVSADGTTVAIGEPFFARGSGPSEGVVRLFRYSTDGRWAQLGSDLNGEDIGDRFGISVSLAADGETVAVAAPSALNANNFRLGHVRVFSLVAGNGWTKLGDDIDAELPSTGTGSGRPVSLSADGRTVAIGTPTVTTDTSGHVRVFRYSTGTGWTKLGSNFEYDSTPNSSDENLSLSADGNTVAIGSPGRDWRTQDRGHVRVYNLDECTTLAPSPAPTLSPSKQPTKDPTVAPTEEPTQAPTSVPTSSHSASPTESFTPTEASTRTRTPTMEITDTPTPTTMPVPTTQPSFNPTKTSVGTSEGGIQTGVATGATTGGLSVIIILVGFCFWRRRNKDSQQKNDDANTDHSDEPVAELQTPEQTSDGDESPPSPASDSANRPNYKMQGQSVSNERGPVMVPVEIIDD